MSSHTPPHRPSAAPRSFAAALLTDGIIGVCAIVGAQELLKIETAARFLKSYFMLEYLDVEMIPYGALFFLVLWHTLGHFLFSPYLKLLEERENAGSGALQAAAQLNTKTTLLLQDYQQKLTAARTAAARDRMQAIARAKDQAAAQLKIAQDEALGFMERERSGIEEAEAKARTAALNQVAELAAELAHKALLPPRPPESLFH